MILTVGTPFTNATATPELAMCAERKGKPRPVFLKGAVARILRQPLRKRRRTAAAIASHILRDAAWWLTHGLWLVPRTLRTANRRKLLLIRPPKSTPAYDVYSHKTHQQYVDQCIQLSQRKIALPSDSNVPILIYVHGGAWGAGDSTHYSQLAANLAQCAEAVVLILSYRLYPTATISEQVHDVTEAMRYARTTFRCKTLTLLAHSSGANVAALALLQNPAKSQHDPLVDVAILTAGPYHLMHHFLFESRRGVAEISPMLPAANADSDHTRFDACSPSVIAENLDVHLIEPSLQAPPDALEGDMAASNIFLPEATMSDARVSDDARIFPRTYILTSSCDTTVPIYSSLRFATALRQRGVAARLLVYDGMAHADFVTDWFFGAKPRDLSDVLDIDQRDRKRRLDCINTLSGPDYVKLSCDDEKGLGVTPYIRDVLRILSTQEPAPNSDACTTTGYSTTVIIQ